MAAGKCVKCDADSSFALVGWSVPWQKHIQTNRTARTKTRMEMKNAKRIEYRVSKEMMSKCISNASGKTEDGRREKKKNRPFEP